MAGEGTRTVPANELTRRLTHSNEHLRAPRSSVRSSLPRSTSSSTAERASSSSMALSWRSRCVPRTCFRFDGELPAPYHRQLLLALPFAVSVVSRDQCAVGRLQTHLAFLRAARC